MLNRIKVLQAAIRMGKIWAANAAANRNPVWAEYNLEKVATLERELKKAKKSLKEHNAKLNSH